MWTPRTLGALAGRVPWEEVPLCSWTRCWTWNASWSAAAQTEVAATGAGRGEVQAVYLQAVLEKRDFGCRAPGGQTRRLRGGLRGGAGAGPTGREPPRRPQRQEEGAAGGGDGNPPGPLAPRPGGGRQDRVPPTRAWTFHVARAGGARGAVRS